MRLKSALNILSALIITLITIVCFWLGCFTVLVKASAETATTYPLADEIFSFTPGAAINKNDVNSMCYMLNLNDPAFETFSSKDERTYSLTFYRVSGDGTSSVAVVEYVFIRYGETLLAAHKNLSYYTEEAFSFSPAQKRGEILGTAITLDSGYILDYSAVVSAEEPDFVFIDEETSKSVRVIVRANDPYTTYFCRFHYEIKKYIRTDTSGWGPWKETTDVYDTYSGSIDSVQRSIYQVLYNMNSVGALDTEFADYPNTLSSARAILQYGAAQRIQVQYLTQIGDSPFATVVTEYVEVPIYATSIPVDRIAAALNVKDFDVLGSSCYCFEYDSATKIYVARYLKNVWLSAKTVDGNSVNYFLDCNLSYKDYYYQMVQDNVFSVDLYEYIFSQILNNYPEVKGYAYDEVYGYFGYVVIPNTYSLNALWAEMFDTNTTFQGATIKYQYTELLTYSSYQTLLTEYQYTWLERAWNGVSGFVTGGSWSADHYLFYADIGYTESFIAENGADDILDDSGLIRNEVEDGVEAGLKFLTDYVAETKAKLKLILGVVVAVSGAVALIVAVIYIRNLIARRK